jgi:hypothetical protein
MESEEVEGPVYGEGRVPTGTRVQIDVPMKTSIIMNGMMFAYSGYFLYHTLKGYYKLIREET